MPAIDECQPQVVRALEKAGWLVDDKPVLLKVPNRKPLYADLRATQDNRLIIVVEVKCFSGELVSDLYTSIGQYLVYRSYIRQLYTETTPELYLAVPEEAYYGILQLAMAVIEETDIKLLIVDIVREEIVQWRT